MEDNYLDKRFKEILENPPQMEPPDSAIEDMRNRLMEGDSGKKRGFVFPIWWPLLLGVPILLSGIFFFQKYKLLNEKFDELNLQLTTIQKDTLINKTVIYQIDTIYNTIYKDVIIERRFEDAEGLAINEGSNNALFSSNNFKLFGEHNESFFSKNPYQEFTNWRKLNAFHQQKGFGLMNPNNPFAKEKEAVEFEVSKNLADLELLSLNLLESDAFAPNLTDKLNEAEPLITKPKKNLITCFQPVGASVGIHGTPYLSAKLPDGFVPGNTFGIHAELHFIKDVQLRLGVERLAINFELKDEGIGTHYPIVNPDDPLDVLHELKGDFSYLQIPIELKKKYRDGKIFQPYFHFGFAAVRPLTQNFTYEYFNSSGEYKRGQKLKNGTFHIDHLRGGIGGEFLLAKNYYAGINVYYQHGLNAGAGEYFKLRYWGVQANFRYQLF